jgi:hypothetical protein
MRWDRSHRVGAGFTTRSLISLVTCWNVNSSHQLYAHHALDRHLAEHGLCHDSKKNEDLNSAGYRSHFW